MILLDSDHLTVLASARHSAHSTLLARLATATDLEIGLPVVAVEEQIRGWMAYINRLKRVHEQLQGYERLTELLSFLSRWRVVNFDKTAADQFEDFRRQRIRIGPMDLKIAAIAVSRDALLLSANLSDFRKVPNLRVENWLV